METQGGTLPLDNQRNPIPAAYRIQMRDATTPTALESPLAVAGVVTELKTPTNAVSLVLKAKTGGLFFGDNSTLDGTAGDGYFELPVGEGIEIDVANGASVWVVQATGAMTLNFFYKKIED